MRFLKSKHNKVTLICINYFLTRGGIQVNNFIPKIADEISWALEM